MISATRYIFLALLGLSILSIVSAAIPHGRRQESNANRLSRGLTPARPKRFYTGSRTNAARAVPSGTPQTPVDTGVIKIYAAGTTTLLGYMGRFGYTPTLGNAWHYTYTPPASPDDLVNFPYYAGYFWAGAVAYVYAGPSVTLGAGRNDYVVFANNQGGATPVGATEGSRTAAYSVGTAWAQNTVFRVDPATYQIFPNWVNADGSVSTQYILAKTVTDGMIYITGDADTLHAQFDNTDGGVPELVDLYFEYDQTEYGA